MTVGGPRVATALAAIADWQIEIVKRADAAGFHVLPKRWVVERTFA
jgi:transposase